MLKGLIFTIVVSATSAQADCDMRDVLETTLDGPQDMRIAEVQACLDAGADVTSTETYWTPFHLAIFQNDIDVVRLFLDAGANPNATPDRYTSLFFTVEQGCRVEIGTLLLDQGAVLTAMDFPDAELTMLLASTRCAETVEGRAYVDALRASRQ